MDTDSDLELVRSDDLSVCGAECADGSACERPTDGGKCYQHREGSDDLPDAPEHLGDHGRECWRSHVADLADAKVLNQVDLTVVEKAAEVYQAGRACWQAVVDGARPSPAGTGRSRKTPLSGSTWSTAGSIDCTRESWQR